MQSKKTKATVTSKGQITIPSSIRKRLGLKTGTELYFDEDAPFLKATRRVDEAEMRTVIGWIKAKKLPSSARLLEDLRGKVEKI